MTPFVFVLSPALNKKADKDIAKLYLDGRLRDGILILGLEEHIRRRTTLVGALQCNWGAAIKFINRDRGKPNEDTGERSSDSSPADFVFGKGVSDNISGDGMLRAVMNIVFLVVNRLEKDSPKDVAGEEAKTTHKKIVVAMFVEAIYALQHQEPSAFTTALLGDSLARVVVDVDDNEQRNGESDAAFHLRTVESKLRESEAMRLQENESSQSKLVQVEHDLKEEKSKRVQAEHKVVWAQSDIDGLLNEVVQLKLDLRKEKSKSAADNENNKPAGEPAKTDLQLIMDDLDEFASTATGVAQALEALYAPAAEVEEQ